MALPTYGEVPDTDSEVYKQVYNPHYLPGHRNISTPYGNTYVYEHGPEDGQKVLLVHGISTPCIALAGVARELVKRGCRVMLFDLYGRGFSFVDPGVEHTAALHTTQILSVLASSPLSWTGDDAFCLVGYSLGGGIAAAFASTFPNLVKSLVLIAPAGLLRPLHTAGSQRFFAATSFWMPEAVWKWVLNRRVGTAPMSLPEPRGSGADPDLEAVEDERVITGPQDERAVEEVQSAIRLQMEYNHTFIRSFISSVRYGPLSGQHAAWRRIGARLDAQRNSADDADARRNGFAGNKVLVLLGDKDAIIPRDEVEPDIKEVLGRRNIRPAIFDAGHHLPVQMPETVTETIWEAWKDFKVVS